MSAASSDKDKHHGEIIIVRRGGDHEDGHHGGAWKIAFADFMTAMMCFFLVMWLINAANEQTKASVASYFNPVKLVDRNTNKKGLDDVGDAPTVSGETENTEAKTAAKAKTDAPTHSDAVEETPKHSDASFFADPYAVLAEISAETGRQQNLSEKGEGGASDSGPADGAAGGEAYRDPFAPDFWTNQVAQNVPEAEASADRPEAKEGAEPDPAPAAAAPAAAAAPPLPVPAPRPEAPQPSGARAAAHAEAEPPAPAAEKAADEIREKIAENFKPGDKAAEEVSVKATDKGVEISITEGLDFGMFEIGSALPEKALVAAMDKIGAVLKERNGRINIKGHTDARPFHNKAYDNWRLSTARAQAAYYMLVRAGLDEKRVAAISGVADREPKDSADPLAAANRRIEILLELPK